MNRPEITIYVANWCGYCQRAKQLLLAKNLRFNEINVEDDAKFRAEMVARSKAHTVPQIFIGERHIGGCDKLVALDRSGELDRLLNQGA